MTLLDRRSIYRGIGSGFDNVIVPPIEITPPPVDPPDPPDPPVVRGGIGQQRSAYVHARNAARQETHGHPVTINSSDPSKVRIDSINGNIFYFTVLDDSVVTPLSGDVGGVATPTIKATGINTSLIPTPVDIFGTDLVAWYERDTGIYDSLVGGSLVTTDGQEIGRWEDSSGNGFHWVRSSAINFGHLQYSKSVTDRGFNTVHFMGDTNAFFGIPDAFRTLIQGVGVQKCEMWVRIINASDAGGNGFCFLGGSNDSHFLYSDGNWYDSFYSTTRRNVGNPTLDTSTAFRVVDLYSITDEWEAFLDNTSQLHITGVGSNVTDNGSTNWHFGRSINAYALSSWVTEIVFTKIKASSTQRDDMYTYMSTI